MSLKHMVKKFWIWSGESASLTGRDHIPPRVFSGDDQIDQTEKELEDLLTGINPFNAKSRAEEICKILDTIFQRREDGHAVRNMAKFSRNSIRKQKLNEKCRTGRIPASAQRSAPQSRSKTSLRRDYDSAVAILEQILQKY
ncbi:MAG: hypothetical protein ACLTXL_14815 [Clostridia bacterium]